MSPAFKTVIVLVLCCVFIVWSGCGSDKKPTDTHSDEVGSYLTDLPSWTEFSPPRGDTEPIPTGDPRVTSDTLDVTTYGDAGETLTLQDVRYTCRETEYSITKNPDKFVMCGGPSVAVLWAGALVQGGSLRDLGDLLPLTIRERTPITVSIPVLPTGENYRTVIPSQATVAAAVGEMVGDAVLNDLHTPSSISYNMRTCHSEEEFALHAGMSARYLRFRASAEGTYSESASKTTITVQFYQRMYEVVVEAPQTPGALFSDEFTMAKLDEQIALGRMGPENLPIYVSKVTYGRMLMFTMTSTATSEEMEATVRLSYSAIGTGASAHLEPKQKKILEQSEYEIASLGGEAQDVLDIIKSGDWSRYFTENPKLSTAEPLSYEFRNLGDGSVALVSETTTYTKKICTQVSQATTFGGTDPYDMDGVDGPDRFCPVKEDNGGDCDFNGPAEVKLWLNYDLEADALRARLDMLAVSQRPGDRTRALSHWHLELLKLPAGATIAKIGGKSPEQWRQDNSGVLQRQDVSGDLSDLQIGIARMRITGDTRGDDLCRDCSDDSDLQCGVKSITFGKTDVELDLGGYCR